MKFENKIITSLIITIILSFSVINTISVLYIRNITEESLIKEAYLYSKLLLYNRSESYPSYLLISEKPVLKEGYTILAYTGRHYILVDNSYIEDKLISFIAPLILWEAGSIIILLLIFYYTIYRYIKRERDSKELLNIMLLALTHRLGNFLAVHKLNIELMNQDTVKNRLKKSVDILENTYNSTIEAIEELQTGQEESPKAIDLPQMLLEITVLYGNTTRKDIRLQVNSSVRIKANPTYMYMLLDTLVDNAIKHSDKRVYIRLLRYKGKSMLVVRNDIKHGDSESGSGLGLRIAKYICEKLNFGMKIRTRRVFTVAVCM
ncbi:sensor histidine kinase [Hydrogenivirga sp.]